MGSWISDNRGWRMSQYRPLVRRVKNSAAARQRALLGAQLFAEPLLARDDFQDRSVGGGQPPVGRGQRAVDTWIEGVGGQRRAQRRDRARRVAERQLRLAGDEARPGEIGVERLHGR